MTFNPKISKQQMMDNLLMETMVFFKSPEGLRIINALHKITPNIQSAFILSHTPEQGEDTYRILLNGDTVMGFELQRGSVNISPLEIIKFNVVEYKKIIKGRRNNEKLENAIALAKLNPNLFSSAL